MSKLEMGDNLKYLQSLAERAKDWFHENNVEVPKTAREWQSKRVKLGELPPNMGYSKLARDKVRVRTLIDIINGETNPTIRDINPINRGNIVELLGLKYISDRLVNSHKKVVVQCTYCGREEELDYCTLQRMRKSGNRFCRYCRAAGGKPKDISYYNKFEGFKPLNLCNKVITLECSKCNNTIERTIAHYSSSEYLVCEYCYPNIQTGTKISTEFGNFDSSIEYEAYKILLKYFKESDIIRQMPYNTLFNTGTKHTCDFYITTLSIGIEVTTKSTAAKDKYKKTMEWKKSLSDSIVFALSLEEVDDIVRSLLKNNE